MPLGVSPHNRQRGKSSERKKGDTHVLRGAEIVRQQIRKQLEEEDNFRQNAEMVRGDMLGGWTPARDQSVMTFLSEDDSQISWLSEDTESPLGIGKMRPSGPLTTLSANNTKGAGQVNTQFSRKGGTVPPSRRVDDSAPVGRGRNKANAGMSLVQRLDHEDDISSGFYDDDLEQNAVQLFPEIGLSEESQRSMDSASYLPKKFHGAVPVSPEQARDNGRKTFTSGSKPNNHAAVVTPPTSSYASEYRNIPSPISKEYKLLQRDAGFCHAQRAGMLWQSMVGQHVRFPSSWWKGARGPPLGVMDETRPWQYYGRYKVESFDALNKVIRNRAYPGRILLHIVVQDLMTFRPVEDIAIGCFHPNARGIRKTSNPDPKDENCRELWLAVRKRCSSVSAIDTMLSRGKVWDEKSGKSPLGPHQRVTNDNVRAVFGEEPPVETIFVSESELYERLASSVIKSNAIPPVAILREFVYPYITSSSKN